MTTQTLSPTPIFKGFDTNGNPLASGKLFSYAAGTTTKLATYTDSTGATPNSNPVILNSRGEAQVWIPPNTAYKYVLAPSTDTDPPSSPIWTVDQITNAQLLTLYAGVDTGIVNAYVLNFAAQFTSYVDGIAIYWIPSHTNTGPSTVNVNGIGAIAIVNADGSALGAGQIVQNQIMFMLCRSGQFYLSTPIGTSGTVNLAGVNVTGSTIPANGIYLLAANTPGLSSNTTLRMSFNATGNATMVAPTFVGPNLTINSAVGAPALQIGDSAGALHNAGFLELPVVPHNANYTAVLADAGQALYHTDGVAYTWTIPANASVAYPIGTTLTFVNDSSGAFAITIAITTDTLVLSPSGTTGSRTLQQYGRATAHKVAASRWIISGTGLT